MGVECPTCGRDDFTSVNGVKLHHVQAHGESIAGQSVGGQVYKDEEWLREKYVEDGMSTPEMADIAGVNSYTTILNWMERYDIERRENRGNLSESEVQRAEETYRDAAWLRKKHWDEGLKIKEIAEEAGVRRDTVSDWFSKLGVPTRYGHSGPASFGTSVRGYERWRHMRHQNSQRVRVHQLLAIAEGAEPEKVFSEGGYQVHHKNHIKWDNRSENIEVLSASEHHKQHFEVKTPSDG